MALPRHETACDFFDACGLVHGARHVADARGRPADVTSAYAVGYRRRDSGEYLPVRVLVARGTAAGVRFCAQMQLEERLEDGGDAGVAIVAMWSRVADAHVEDGDASPTRVDDPYAFAPLEGVVWDLFRMERRSLVCAAEEVHVPVYVHVPPVFPMELPPPKPRPSTRSGGSDVPDGPDEPDEPDEPENRETDDLLEAVARSRVRRAAAREIARAFAAHRRRRRAAAAREAADAAARDPAPVGLKRLFREMARMDVASPSAAGRGGRPRRLRRRPRGDGAADAAVDDLARSLVKRVRLDPPPPPAS